MDYCLIATAYQKMVRIYVAQTTKLVEKMRQIHDTWPTASAALGRFLTISAMMGLMYKNKERLTLSIKGDGPIGSMIIDANASGEVRADIDQPHVYLKYEDGPKKGKLNVAKAIGDGFLTVTKDLNMRDFFSSSAKLVSKEVAEDFTYYFATSEQTPSSVAAGVLVNTDQTILASGGFIIQALPNCHEEVITIIEKILADIPSVTTMINNKKTPENILHLLANGTEEILSKRQLKYKCHCSKKRFKKSLSTLDEEVINEMIREDKGAEIICNFCHKRYFFDEQELLEIATKNKK